MFRIRFIKVPPTTYLLHFWREGSRALFPLHL